MKAYLIAMILGAFFLVGCDDGGPEDIIEDRGPTIEVVPEPEGIGAAWVLTGPDGYSLSDTGYVFLEGMTTGDYTVDWGIAAGWRNSPEDEMRTLTADSTVSFTGVYTNNMPEAHSEDQLMANLQEHYAEMRFDGFQEMLHPDHRTILIDSTIDSWGMWPGTTFDYDTMVCIHEIMFGGSTGLDMYGNIIDSIMSVDILVFERMIPWVEVPQDDIYFPESRMALYDVVIRFNSSSGIHAFEVSQNIEFYVRSVEDIWYLGGILPYPVEGKATEEISIDAVLAFYQ